MFAVQLMSSPWCLIIHDWTIYLTIKRFSQELNAESLSEFASLCVYISTDVKSYLLCQGGVCEV